jgi:hypothetical protein
MMFVPLVVAVRVSGAFAIFLPFETYGFGGIEWLIFARRYVGRDDVIVVVGIR